MLRVFKCFSSVTVENIVLHKQSNSPITNHVFLNPYKLPQTHTAASCSELNTPRTTNTDTHTQNTIHLIHKCLPIYYLPKFVLVTKPTVYYWYTQYGNCIRKMIIFNCIIRTSMFGIISFSLYADTSGCCAMRSSSIHIIRVHCPRCVTYTKLPLALQRNNMVSFFFFFVFKPFF